MKFGIHAYAWCVQWSNDTLDLIDRVKGLGLDFIEIPLMALETFDAKAVKERLQKVGLDACTSTVLSVSTNVASEDPEVRKKGVQYLKDCIKATADIGATSFTGVLYSAHNDPNAKRPTEETWVRVAACLKEAAQYAQTLGVTLGLEPANRYETSVVTTCQQAVDLIERIDEPNMRIHLDSYHMNVEEKDFYTPTKLAGNRLIHYHMCENDRGIPGTGHVDWDGIFKALGEMHYDGYAALESFVDLSLNMNTYVWRQLAPDGDTLVREGIAFIKSMQKKYGLA